MVVTDTTTLTETGLDELLIATYGSGGGGTRRRRGAGDDPTERGGARHIRELAALLDPTPCACVAIDTPEIATHPETEVAFITCVEEMRHSATTLLATHSETMCTASGPRRKSSCPCNGDGRGRSG